ncbi:MULE transposase domain [Sesbania bispinosa]|nr:MULE transposase domain [Sesbania bispinosa]
MEENCWNNNYEGFNATTDFENDVEMVDLTDNPMEGRTDYSNTFTTNEIFGNRDELLKWVCETGRTHGFVVVILRSDAGGNGRKTTLVLGCERSGVYKPYKKELTCNVTGNLEGHAYAGRLTTDELSLLNDMTKNMVKPRNILLTLKDHNKVAFAYIEQEKSDNFMWVLEKIRSMILVLDVSLKVIVTDRDIALMNAVEKVFPIASHLLCQFHIAKNMKAKCKTLVSNTFEWKAIMNVWMSLMHSPTEADFEMNLAHFEQVCSTWGLFRTYVNHTWLMPHKEKFVDAWINKNMHPGTTTTNRVESAHSRLKNMLQDCRGLVSRNALALIDNEKQRINYVGIDSSACGCTLRMTHGLPCACELARYVCMGNHIPITEVHTMWMRLTFNDECMNEPWLGFSVRPECDEVIRQFELVDLTGKLVQKSKMREVAYPQTTSMCPPPEKVKTKGGVKGKGKSKYSTKREPSLFEHVDAMHS